MPRWLFHAFISFQTSNTSSPIFNLSRWPFSFIMRHLEQSEENFHRFPTPCLLISVIFPYSAFPPLWNIHALIESPSLRFCRRCYPFSHTQWHHTSNTSSLLLQHQICTLLNSSPQRTNILLFLPSKTTTNFYWPSSPPIYHLFFAPFATKLLEGVVYTPCLQFHFSNSLLTHFN